MKKEDEIILLGLLEVSFKLPEGSMDKNMGKR